MSGKSMEMDVPFPGATGEHALSYMVDATIESRGLGREELLACKKVEIEMGMRDPVSSDEWFSAAVEQLIDVHAFGYSVECAAGILGCSPEVVKRVVAHPSEVELAVKYEMIGRLARFMCLAFR